MAGSWRDRTVDQLLAAHGLTGGSEEPFPTDGWSGAHFTRLRAADGSGLIAKRAALAHDWIARSTLDIDLREAALVDRATSGGLPGLSGDASPIALPYLGAAADGAGSVILMPDLSDVLLAWERPGHEGSITPATVGLVIEAIARLHAADWTTTAPRAAGGSAAGGTVGAALADVPWCPLRERLLLLSRPAATGYAAQGNPVGERFLAGWDAFDRRASPAARALIEGLAAEPEPLLAALGRLPAVGLHGDLKLSNVAVWSDGRVGLIDWQMTLRAAVAVELGWLLVSNVAVLTDPPERVLSAYVDAVRRASPQPDGVVGDPTETADLAWIVGLLLRGWRKGLDAEAGVTLPSDVAGADDLAWWCARALEAADRRL